MAYVKIQAIRKQAGAQLWVKGETPVGTVNGTNAIFLTKKKPLVDINWDDELTVADVIAYVNNVVVDVSAVDPVAGQVTLQTAPANGAVVVLDYAFSWADDQSVEDVREEAEDWVNTKVNDYVDTPLSPVPGILATATKLYAAGLLMTQREGMSDTTEMMKTGKGYIEMARDLINDYIKGLGGGDDSAATANVEVKTDGNIFPRNTTLDDTYGEGQSVPDDYFMRR